MSPLKTLTLRVIASLLFVGAMALAADAKKSGPADLSLASIERGKTHLKDLRGKVVVLNMWATWCGPCREEMPMMVEAEKHSRAKVSCSSALSPGCWSRRIPRTSSRNSALPSPSGLGATSDDLWRGLH